MSRISFSNQPTIWIGVISSIIAIAIAFGAPISHSQIEAVLAAIPAVGAALTWTQVSPAGKTATAPPAVLTADQVAAMVNADKAAIEAAQARLRAIAVAAAAAVVTPESSVPQA